MSDTDVFSQASDPPEDSFEAYMNIGASEIDTNEKNFNDEGNNIEQVAYKLPEEKGSELEVGMLFDTPDDFLKYYMKYGNEKGFQVKTRSSGKGDDREKLKWVILACSRAGVPKSRSKNAFKMRPICKTNCKAMARAAMDIDGKWRVTSVCLEHNHDLSPGLIRFYRKNRVLRADVKRRLEINDKAGIRANKSFHSLLVENGGHENVTFLEKDCYNYIHKVRHLRLGEGDANALLTYFKKMLSDHSDFFYEIVLDEENRLKNVFWADGRSRAAYEEFGDVVTFDTTYLTNRYDMPFAPFVGVNHHGHSILLGCGLISNEDTPTFTWLFRSWLDCMKNCAPASIVTDQDKAINKAIGIVFPNTCHRWCLWHIMRKVPEKLHGYKAYNSIRFHMEKAVYDSLTYEEFEKSWNWFVQEYKLKNNDWLMGLYNERHRWVPAYVKDHFWAGMSTTQRSEGINAFFKGYVHGKTTLKQFVEQYENALRSKVQKEEQDDFNSFNSRVPCISNHVVEEQFQSIYTTAKFKEFQKELQGKLYCHVDSVTNECGYQLYKISEVVDEKINRQITFTVSFYQSTVDIKCNCRLFEFRRILCRHILIVMQANKVYQAPEKYILRRWRKDVRRRHTSVKVPYFDWGQNPENERFNMMCNAFSKTSDLACKDINKTEKVMRVIKWLDEEMEKEVGVSDHGNPIPFVNEELKGLSSSVDLNHTTNKGNGIQTPLAVRCKGRAPFKRKKSQVERAIINKIAKEDKQKKKYESKKKKRGGDDNILCDRDCELDIDSILKLGSKKKKHGGDNNLSGEGDFRLNIDGLLKPSKLNFVSSKDTNILQKFGGDCSLSRGDGFGVHTNGLNKQNNLEFISIQESNTVKEIGTEKIKGLKDWTDEEYIDSVLVEFDPRIKQHIVAKVGDVLADGQCGYRCCAELLGLCPENGWMTVRQRMYIELVVNKSIHIGMLDNEECYNAIKSALFYFKNDYVPMKYWMQLPDMGSLFATAFNCVLCVLSPYQYTTYLPLRLSPPKPPEEVKFVQMVLVDNNHFMKFFWKECAPIPPVYKLWLYHHCEAASEWGDIVAECIGKWRDLVGRPRSIRGEIPSIQTNLIEVIDDMEKEKRCKDDGE